MHYSVPGDITVVGGDEKRALFNASIGGIT